jgi:hypothetical protein
MQGINQNDTVEVRIDNNQPKTSQTRKRSCRPRWLTTSGRCWKEITGGRSQWILVSAKDSAKRKINTEVQEEEKNILLTLLVAVTW